MLWVFGRYIYTSLSPRYSWQPKPIICRLISLGLGWLMGLYWSYKTNKNKISKITSLPNEPDCLRTTPPDIGFVNVSNTTESPESIQVQATQSCKLLDCQVVLDYVFSTSPNENFKRLESNEDKTLSVSSHRFLDWNYLVHLFKKESIAWPRMVYENNWEELDGGVSNLLVNFTSLFGHVTLLEDVICNKACQLFGVFSGKRKNLCGLSRRA